MDDRIRDTLNWAYEVTSTGVITWDSSRVSLGQRFEDLLHLASAGAVAMKYSQETVSEPKQKQRPKQPLVEIVDTSQKLGPNNDELLVFGNKNTRVLVNGQDVGHIGPDGIKVEGVEGDEFVAVTLTLLPSKLVFRGSDG